MRGRINVVETPAGLILSIQGAFLPGKVETVIEQDALLEIYRNPLLAEAMVNLNMIDTQGGEIKRMFQRQRKRFFPMPAYHLFEPELVKVEIQGRVLVERYTRLLMANTDLDLFTIILPDKLPEVLSEEQKRTKIHNPLSSLSGKKIQTAGLRGASRWVLIDRNQPPVGRPQRTKMGKLLRPRQPVFQLAAHPGTRIRASLPGHA